MLDRRLVERVADSLLTEPSLVEKDWHVTRAIGVLAGYDHGAVITAFGGGTSLSKAWGLIRRFSEDIDFKVTMPPAGRNRARRECGAYRERIIKALADAGFEPMGEVVKRDENRFFSAEFLFRAYSTPAAACARISASRWAWRRRRCRRPNDRSARSSRRQRANRRKCRSFSRSIRSRPRRIS